ncbi:hypothetical protein IV102_13525 [bacterium]|nr:hypothetical protein [bacterium]
MPILGAVLNLAAQDELRNQALHFLAGHPAVTLGEAQSKGLPVVIEFATRSEERAIWEQLSGQPGILFFSVVYADFSDIVLRESHEHESSRTA